MLTALHIRGGTGGVIPLPRRIHAPADLQGPPNNRRQGGELPTILISKPPRSLTDGTAVIEATQAQGLRRGGGTRRDSGHGGDPRRGFSAPPAS